MQNLDETHGLTSEQLASWLLRHGWEKQPQYAFQLGGPSVLTGYQFCKQGSVIATGSPLHDAIAQLAELEKRNLQSILREINPRMRKGCPSNAAIQAHDGPWLELRGVSRMPGVTEFGLDPDQSQREWMEDYCKDALFWPCDRHGNKVPWPTDATGEML